MRGRLRVLALALGLAAAGCSGDGNGAAEGVAEGKGAETEGRPVENELGHQAFQPSTRLVVPAGEGDPLDRAARVLAGLSEGPLGTRLFVDQRPGEIGRASCRERV